MTTLYGNGHKVLVMLLVASLLFASLMAKSHARPMSQPIEEEGQRLGELKSVLELSGRDEMVRMAGYGEEKLSTVLISGAVLCNRVCLNTSYQLPLQPISGALVGVTCQPQNTDKRQITGAKAITDKYGEFTIDLPSELHAIIDLHKACLLKVLQISRNSTCGKSDFSGKQQGIRLSYDENGIRTYAAGTVTFQSRIPENSEDCMKKMDDTKEM